MVLKRKCAEEHKSSSACPSGKQNNKERAKWIVQPNKGEGRWRQVGRTEDNAGRSFQWKNRKPNIGKLRKSNWRRKAIGGLTEKCRLEIINQLNRCEGLWSRELESVESMKIN